MSILRDILDLRDDIEETGDDFEFKFNGRGSIAKEASPGVLQFPVIVSTALSLEEVTMISKALEREYVSFISIITSIDSVTDEKSINQYLSRIHQNFNGELFDMNVRESVVFSLPLIRSNTKYDPIISENVIEGLLPQLTDNTGSYLLKETDEIVSYDDISNNQKNIVKNFLYENYVKQGCKCHKFRNNVNTILISERNEYTKHIVIIKSKNGGVKLMESCCFPKSKGSLIPLKQDSYDNMKEYVPDLNTSCLNDMSICESNFSVIGRSSLINKNNEFIQEADMASTVIPSAFEDTPLVIDAGGRNSSVVKDILRDNDVKKANELIPTTMHLKTYFKDKDGALHGVDYMIGVKTIVHPIKSESIVINLASALKRGKGFFNLMRLTTGEISFFKDFVFTVGRTKDDIKLKYKDNPWWNALIRRKKYSSMLRRLNFKQQLVPNTSIIITMDEVEKLKIEHSIDLMDLKKAHDIMNQLFLLGLVIVDSSIETAYFLFDGQRNYQQYSFNALERENSNSAKDIKNIMQVLGRM